MIEKLLCMLHRKLAAKMAQFRTYAFWLIFCSVLTD